MYKRKKKTNYQYYSCYKYKDFVDEYFSAIVPDLKKFFFNLTAKDFLSIMLKYKEKYGEKAYEYALKTYPKWKSYQTSISPQTALRLIEFLPLYLTTRQRSELLEKLIQMQMEKCTGQYDYITLTYNNYGQKIFELSSTLKSKINSINSSLPKEIYTTAGWLFDNDMYVAQTIINEFYTSVIVLKINNALQDLLLFKLQADKAVSIDDVYTSMSIEIDTYFSKLYINILPKQKPITKYINEFFGRIKNE